MQLSQITQSLARRGWSPVAQLARLTSQATRQRSKAVAAVLLAGTALAGGAVALAAGNAKLTITDGVVVKFGEGAGINVRDQLQTGSNVIFTSQFDDTALGATNPQAEAPEAGDWLGLFVAKDVPTTGLKIDGLTIRYAGGTTGLPSYMNGGAGLVLNGGAYGFNRLQFSGNTVGIRVIGTGSPSIAKSRLVQNGVGLLAEQGATPVISESDISANTQFGVRNTNPATIVQAQGNWWGHASGPKDAVGNPAGQGNAVSTGVDYGSYLTAEPVLTCTIAPTQGYITRIRNIELILDCPQAAQYRIQESDQFTDTLAWQNMAGNPTKVAYTLSAGSGDKMLYVQFRTAQNKINQFSLSQPVAYAPEGPVVQFTQPAANAVLEQDTTIAVTATDAEGVRDVEILVGDNRLALLSAAPYQAQWSLAGVPNGTYTLKAKATNTEGLNNTVTRTVQVQKQGGSGPAIAASFAGQPLQANAVPSPVITQPGLLTVTAESAVGVTNIKAAVDGAPIFDRSYSKTSPVTYSQLVDFAQLPNGNHKFTITATDADGIAAILDIPFTLTLSAPAAPSITQPAGGTTVAVPQLSVAGTAMPGSQVQLFLNGQASGSPVTAGANGSFGASITLPAEGVHQVEATATNSRGTSPKSVPVGITYTSAAPTVSFVAPAPNAVLSSATTVTVVASAPAGIAKVDIYANDTLIASPAQAPYSAQWAANTAADGSYTLKAVATSLAGKTAQAIRTVLVQNAPIAPEVPKTPYTGTVSGVTPAVSYGTQPIVITGMAVTRDTAQAIPNAALRMVLDIAGFKRRINIATDANGQYRYEFVPAANDNGTYIVSVIHPEETMTAEQGRFTINRLSFDISVYNLTAARDFASSITVNARASAGTGATGVRWAVVPANQPSGSLPPGIGIDVGQPVNIAAGASVPMVIKFTGSSSAGETGTVILTAFAAETGDTPRGTFTINYKLVQARPDLFAKPTFIETGVQQESTVTESVVIGNRGLVPAQNVQVKLVDSNGNPPPAWMFLASGNQIGAIDVGGEVPIQVTASPGKTVADGIYNFKLSVTASNSGDGSIPVSVAVTQSGQGGVNFHVTDLFTETLGADNKPIKGVAGARIRLQNDAVLTYIRTLTTDAEGKTVVTDLPPGTYTYRASGPRHADKSGRIFVRPGITASERIHLQYQTISIDFSVTETTIQDVYNINLEATFQTQVPAPVVLLEPLSINLPELQIGEEFTGELTLTNYGLIEAEEVAFKPPQSDEYYKYEFLADIPKVLAAKQRIVIPYRVTAIKLHPKGIGFTKAKAGDFTEVQRALAKTFSTKAASCSSYSVWATAECSFECVNGERENRVVFSQYSRLVGTGTSCTGGGSSGPPIYYGPRLPGGDGGGWGGSGSGSGTPLPLAPECTPHCRGECCAKGGSGPGDGE
ncbi:Ig-like domain-containing protein [Comamonas testosteroni]